MAALVTIDPVFRSGSGNKPKRAALVCWFGMLLAILMAILFVMLAILACFRQCGAGMKN
jgi:hypothetical protein